jgi:hypothetical protein
MPILQKEKTIGSVGIPARTTGGTRHKQCGQNAHTTERKSIGSVGIPARSTGGTQQKQCGQNAHTTERKNHR